MQNLIPQPGLGTFRLLDEVVIASVRSAIDLGYRHIDTATLYDNESAVGKAIVASGVPREELFVTTKVWFDSLAGNGVIESLQNSLQRLGMEYVDLALIHWPSPDDQVPMEHYIATLNQAREMGLTRHIGISNFTVTQVDRALASPGGEHIITNQVEVHPYLANRHLIEHCHHRGLAVTGYMPLAVGKVMDDPVLQDIASKHGVTPAQIALAWVASQDVIVIPSSTKPAHQQANLDALNITLSEEDMARIDALDCNDRIANPDFAPVWD